LRRTIVEERAVCSRYAEALEARKAGGWVACPSTYCSTP